MSGAALSIADRVSQFWFAPMPPERLSVARILIVGFALYRLALARHSMIHHAELGMVMLHPMGAMRLLAEAPSVDVVRGGLWLSAACGVASVLGFGQRLVGPLFAALFFAACSYVNSFGMLYHTDQLLVLHLLVLAVAPASDAWSLDAYVRARRGEVRPHADWRYGWPIRLLCVLTVSIYWLAAIAKLVAHGWAWMFGAALRGQIAKDALRKQLLGQESGWLGPFVWQNAWVASLVGVGTMVMELGAPLFMMSRRSGRVWAVAAFAMHWGILLIMGIKFRYQLCGIAFVSFFDGEQLVFTLVRRFKRLRATPS